MYKKPSSCIEWTRDISAHPSSLLNTRAIACLPKEKIPKSRENTSGIEISKGFWSDRRRHESEMGSAESD
jgi:hypothetical protein